MNPSAESSKLAIGFLENRHTGFQSFPVKNFKDMLEFELMEQGFGILDYSPDLLNDAAAKKPASGRRAIAGGDPPPPEQNPEEPEKDPFLSRSSATDDLFPSSFRTIAGETEAKRKRKIRDRMLTAKEIERLSSILPFDFFVQGAVGTTERNIFSSDLDEEEDSLVFLKIYDPTGKRVGAIRFFVEQKSYSRPKFLREVSRRIVQNFQTSVQRTAAPARSNRTERSNAPEQPDESDSERERPSAEEPGATPVDPSQ